MSIRLKRKNEDKKLSLKIVRQIELLTKYYDVDVENRIINLELHYEKASDIIVKDIAIKKAPQFSEEVLAKVTDVLNSFPLEFKVNLSIELEDYEGYDPKIFVESFKDSLEIFNYQVDSDKNFRWIAACSLVFTSFILLFIRLFLGNKGVIDTNGLLYEMMDIIAWVFLWEAVTILFLNPKELKSVSFKIISRLLTISFLDGNHNMVAHVSNEELEKSWIKETKGRKLARYLLLISGAGLITFAFVSGFSIVDFIINDFNKIQSYQGVIYIVIYIIEIILFILAGIGSVSKFNGHGPFQRAVKVLAVLCVIAIGLTIAANIFSMASTQKVVVKDVAELSFSLGFTILFVVAYFVTRHFEKLDDKIKEEKHH